ncbi:MAG: Dam family site-specific DNA-(adenine-N6)-methyltransferase [Anaerolineales bacterium]|nr:Dam family site-specific DNA-(adenine-N6)-methyltransferase [Anaerolineales bacterium]
MKVRVPPIKSQGIKTKLVPWINSLVAIDFAGTWIEPFMGTAVVAFNLASKNALLADTNPHLINFYQAIATKCITPGIVRQYLEEEGDKLLEVGEAHYYAIRDRFNREQSPLDFLFLSRAGFNGMIRFNRKREFNVPFCRKPHRFSPAYITKIVNQVDFVAKLVQVKDFQFKCQNFTETIHLATADDLIYCDPPYIGRHVDYYNSWDDACEMELYELLAETPAAFILSTWHHNAYRKNEYVDSHWSRFNVLTREHFYHVGASEKNRNPMIEAIVTNMDISTHQFEEQCQPRQLQLLDEASTYLERQHNQQEIIAKNRVKVRTANLHKGAMLMNDDFDEPLPDDFWFGDGG